MGTNNDFLAWERATDHTIDFKTCYVDVATEDIVGGLLLKPDRLLATAVPKDLQNQIEGRAKLRDVDRKGA